MTNIHQLPHQEQCYDEASQWIAKLDKGLSTQDQEALRAWMAADVKNKTVLLDMAALWDKMDTLSRLSDLFSNPKKHRFASPRFRPAIAASVIIALFVGTWALFRFEQSNDDIAAKTSAMVYQTAVGEHSSIMLADGTQMVLNTNSLIKVNYTERYRLLMLERGEVHVRVAKDQTRPLSVIAGDKVVQAIGTEFNIEIKNDQKIELVVTEGKVRVGVHDGRKMRMNKKTLPILPASSKTVSAGEEIVLGSPEEQITEVSPEDIEVKLSWQKGNLIFRGESLEDAVKEVGRYTSVEFVFLDDNLKKVRVAGLFKAGDVEGLLATLRENFDIVSRHTEGQRVLLSSE